MNGQKAMSVFRLITGRAAAAAGAPRSRNRVSRGQSALEFALIAPLALVIMLIGVQYALIGQAAVATSQGSSALARYVANNPGVLGTNNGSVSGSSLPAGAQQLLSQSILNSGGNDLTVTVSSKTGTGAIQNGTPVAQSDQVTISLSYVTTSKLALPNPFMRVPPIFPGISFPGTVGASDSQMYEQ